MCLATPLLAICWLASIPFMQLTAIHPSDVTERGLILKRISPAFVEAVQDYREDRRREQHQEGNRRESGPHRDEARIRRSPRPEDLEL